MPQPDAPGRPADRPAGPPIDPPGRTCDIPGCGQPGEVRLTLCADCLQTATLALNPPPPHPPVPEEEPGPPPPPVERRVPHPADDRDLRRPGSDEGRNGGRV